MAVSNMKQLCGPLVWLLDALLGHDEVEQINARDNGVDGGLDAHSLLAGVCIGNNNNIIIRLWKRRSWGRVGKKIMKCKKNNVQIQNYKAQL